MEGLQLADLTAVIGDSTLFGSLKQHLQLQQSYKETHNNEISTAVPLEKHTKRQISRSVAYRQSCLDVSKWRPFVDRNRDAATIDLSENYANSLPRAKVTLTQMAAVPSFQATQLEEQVAAILSKSGFDREEKITEKETSVMQGLLRLTPEEAAERHASLAKERSVQFFHELKCKHSAKIKSKAWRKHNRRNEAADIDVTDERVLAELERAKQRLTLRSKKPGRYLKELAQSGGAFEAHEQANEPEGQNLEDCLIGTANQDEAMAEDDAQPERAPPQEEASGRFSVGEISRPAEARQKCIAIPKSDLDDVDFEAQQQLIARAFAIDAVSSNPDDFSDEKRQAVDRDVAAQVTAPVFLPGWGNWTGHGAVESKRSIAMRERVQREYEEKKMAAVQARSDANLPHVILNQSVTAPKQKLPKHIPYPFETLEQYLHSLKSVPVGRQWTSQQGFERSIRPRVQVKPGALIRPPVRPE